MVSGYSKFTGILQIDGLSTGPLVLGHHINFNSLTLVSASVFFLLLLTMHIFT